MNGDQLMRLCTGITSAEVGNGEDEKNRLFGIRLEIYLLQK